MHSAALLVFFVALAGCTRPGGPYPSLAPRAAEAIDPRLPVAAPVNDRTADPALVERLSSLLTEARAGDAAFSPAIAAAERAANAAGPPQGENWIAAQQALSAAIAARALTGRALVEIDALGAGKLQAQGGLAPSDLQAIEQAAAAVRAIDARQQQRIAALLARLGS